MSPSNSTGPLPPNGAEPCRTCSGTTSIPNPAGGWLRCNKCLPKGVTLAGTPMAHRPREQTFPPADAEGGGRG